MTTYTAVYDYDPDDDVWIVEVAGEPRCHTFGRTLAAAKRGIRDALTMWAEGDYDVADQVRPPAATADVVKAALEARARVPEAVKEADRLTRAATAHLQHAGLSVREAAEVLGISRSRVSQFGGQNIVAPAKAGPRADAPTKAAPRAAGAVKAAPKKDRVSK